METARNNQLLNNYWDMWNREKMDWLRRAERDVVKRYGLPELGNEVVIPDTVDSFLMSGRGWNKLSPHDQRIYFCYKRKDIESREPDEDEQMYLLLGAAPAQFFAPVENAIIEKFMRDGEVTELSRALQLAASQGRADFAQK